jgi:hypothetical protein
MKYLVEFVETFIDADGFQYIDESDVEYSADTENEAKDRFISDYPNTIHFKYDITRISPLELST